MKQIYHFILWAFISGIDGCINAQNINSIDKDLEKAKQYVISNHDSSKILVAELKKIKTEPLDPLHLVKIFEIEGLYLELILNDYSNATQKYLEGINIAEEHNLSYLKNMYHNLGIMFHTMDEYDKAREYYLKTVDLLNNQKDNELFIKVKTNLGSIYSSTGNFENAIKEFEEALRLKPDFEQERSIHSNLGNLYLRLDKPQIALPFLEKAVSENPSTGAKGDMYDFGFLINAKVKLKDTTDLKLILNDAISLLNNSVNLRDKTILLKSIYEALDALGDHKNASFYKSTYIASFDSLMVEQRNKTVYELETKYATKQKEEALKVQTKEKTRLLWISSFAGLVILVLSYLIMTNEKQRKKLNLQKNQLEILVEEKNTLMKETHHRVKNSFQIVSSLLYLQSENMSDKEAALAVKEAQNRVKSMILIHQKLYSKDQLVGIDSREYIEDLVNDIIENQSDSIAGLKISTAIDSKIFSIDTITPLGLIINELITNVIKYAFPNKIENPELFISFLKKENNYELTVSDNGIGIPNQNNSDSFGLKLIHSLAKKLKATVSFENENGTKVTLLITKFEELS